MYQQLLLVLGPAFRVEYIESACKEAAGYLAHVLDGGTAATWKLLPLHRREAYLPGSYLSFLEAHVQSPGDLAVLEVSLLRTPQEPLQADQLRSLREDAGEDFSSLLDLLLRAVPIALTSVADCIRRSTVKRQKKELKVEESENSLCADLVRQLLDPYPAECQARVLFSRGF